MSAQQFNTQQSYLNTLMRNQPRCTIAMISACNVNFVCDHISGFFFIFETRGSAFHNNILENDVFYLALYPLIMCFSGLLRHIKLHKTLDSIYTYILF